MEPNPNPQDPPTRDESTGLPWFPTWRGVYLFVFGCFIACVVLLTVLSMVFS
jgi:hypothetical protein